MKINVKCLRIIFLFLLTLNLSLFMTNSQAQDPVKSDKTTKTAKPTKPNKASNMLYIDLKYGQVVIELLPKIAPKHVARVSNLADTGFYDNVKFHRVIKGFMAQTGDPTGTGMGGSDLPDLKAEFSNEPHIRGAVSMARASSPNSANSQFFIVTDDSRFLDGDYTVFGRVIEGMKYVDQIKKGSGSGGVVDNPDVMLKVRTTK